VKARGHVLCDLMSAMRFIYPSVAAMEIPTAMSARLRGLELILLKKKEHVKRFSVMYQNAARHWVCLIINALMAQ